VLFLQSGATAPAGFVLTGSFQQTVNRIPGPPTHLTFDVYVKVQ
jgi:hypothetical protein